MPESIQIKPLNNDLNPSAISSSIKLNDITKYFAKNKTEKDSLAIKKSGQKKITFSEGISHVANGAIKQFQDTILAIIKNPKKSVLLLGGTALGLMVLPFMGIPIAAGTTILALGYAGLATYKGIRDISKFIKNYNSGNYNKARKNLEKIGRNTFDFAISVPFIPKGLKSIANFHRYGKFGINKDAIRNIKESDGMINKIKATFSTGKNLDRKLNFSNAIEIEFTKLKNITTAEKIKIRKYVEKYNVPREKIPDVVLDLWAIERGIKTKPKWNYLQTPKNTAGAASNSDCRILLKDRTKSDVPKQPGSGGQVDPIWEKIAQQDMGRNYKITYRNTRTGKTQTQILDKKVHELRNNLGKEYHKLSQEGQEITSLIHEREHIDQFARIYSIGENWKGHHVKPEAAHMYKEMAKDMKPMTPSEIAKYKAMANYKNNGTMANYVMEPCEICAREAEAKFLARKDFQILDKVFKTNSKLPKPNNTGEIALNTIRTESTLKNNKKRA